MKTQHAQLVESNSTWNEKINYERMFHSYNVNDEYVESVSSSSNEKQPIENDEIVLLT
jgi:hypothetical protein